MKRQRMAEQWDAFARAVLPANASWTQKLEMRRAFYAGAQAILFHVIVSLAPESEPTAEDLQMMDDLDQELKEFGELVQAGRA